MKLFGDDLGTLRAKAGEIEAVMAQVDGIVDLQIEQQVLIPQLRIRIDPDKARQYGIKPGEMAHHLERSFHGEVVAQILEDQRTYDILVRYDEDARKDPLSFGRALVDTPSGATVPVSAFAEVVEGAGPNIINHDNGRRRIVISANAEGRDVGGVVTEVQRRLAEEVELPVGYFLSYEGQFESQQSATRLIAVLSLFSMLGMFLLLYAHFRSVTIVLQVMLNIPLALIGSVAAVALSGGVFSVATLVGFITLCGIASRNTIMMISHYLHLVEVEGEQFNRAMIVRGSLERLVPVLMTALCAGLALIPLVLAAGEPGKEILYPVATVIVGGLFSSTLLDMVVTPAVFYKFGGKALEKYIADRASRAQDEFGPG